MANSAVVGTLRAVLSADTAEFASAMKKAGDAADQTAKDMTKASASFEAAGGRMASVTRLIKDFSGSLEKRTAEEFALAIEKIGGAARLSESELRRASGVFDDYMSKAKALGQEVPQHLQKVSSEISKLSSVSTANVGVIGQIRGAFQNLGPSILSAAGGFATALISVEALTRGLRAGIEFVKDSIQAYAEAEKANRKLTAALEAQGQATPKVVRAYQDLANQFQKTTVFQDDLITEMQTLLVQVGNVMPNEMEKALTAVTNLASGLGIDLRSATLMVAKAAEDNFTALGRQGVQIDATRAKAEGFDYVLGQINAKFGGQAAADLATFDGQLKATANQFDELKEQIGKVIVQSTAFQLAFAAIRAELAQLQHEINVVVAGFKVLGTVPGPVGSAFSVFFGNLKQAEKSAKDVHLALVEWQGPMQSSEDKLKSLTTATKANTKAVDESEKQYQEWARTVTGQKLADEIARLDANIVRLTKDGKVNAQALKETAQQAQALAQRGGELSPRLQSLVNEFIGLKAGVVSTTVTIPKFSDALSLSGDEVRAYAKDLQEVAKKFDDLNKIINTSKGAQDLFKGGVSGEDLQKSRDKILSFSQEAAKSMLMLGDVFSEVAHTIGGDAGRIVGAVGQIAEGIGKLLTPGMGLEGLLQIAGSVVSVIGRQFKTLGRNIARDMQDAFATTELGFANLAALNDELKRLGAVDLVNRGDRAQRKDDEAATRKWMEDVKKFLSEADQKAVALASRLAAAFDELSGSVVDFGGKAPAALQPFIQELLKSTKLTEEQRLLLQGLAGAPEWQQLQSIAEKYGISLGSLGQQFQESRIGDLAMQYARDFMTLRDAGGDVNGILAGMQDEVQALVLESLKFGVALPEALRDVVQGLINMGQLTDENGDALTDLSRINFKGTLEDAFLDIKSILEEIRDLLAGGLPKAAEEGARGIGDAFKDTEIEIPVKWNWGDMRPPDGFGRSEVDAPSAQHGGVVSKTGLVNVHAGEIIQPLDEAGADRYAIYLDNYLDGRKVTETVLIHTREVARRIGVRPI